MLATSFIEPGAFLPCCWYNSSMVVVRRATPGCELSWVSFRGEGCGGRKVAVVRMVGVPSFAVWLGRVEGLLELLWGSMTGIGRKYGKEHEGHCVVGGGVTAALGKVALVCSILTLRCMRANVTGDIKGVLV